MATDLLDIQINIGASTEDLGAEIQKAENLLKKLQSALKKSTDVGEINQLNTKIAGVETSLVKLNTRMSSVGKPTSDATNALSNLSRVAQDAPYGFIGIANNLNPLLESFQRLQKESAGSGGALKAMVAGLTGPAGIGLALGVVSSLAVTYSKEISAFFKGPTDELKKFREELNKLNADIYKVAGEAQANRSKGINLVEVIVGKDQKAAATALKSLQDLYTKNAGIQNAKLGQDKAYYTSLVNLASLQELAIGKESINEDQLKQLQVKRRQLQAQRNAELKEAEKLEGIFGFPKAARVSAEKMRVGIKYDAELATLDRLIAEAQAKNKDFVKAVSEFETPDPKKGPSPIVNYAREENKALNLELAKMKALREKMKSIGLEPLQLFELPSEERAKEDKRKGYFQKQSKELLESTQKEGGFGAYMQGIFKKDKSDIDSEAAEKKRIDDLTQSYAQFAQTLSSNVTNGLFSMYDAMQQGQNPLEAFANAFLQIGKNIAAMVIQALIFEKIMNAFPALKGAFAALGLVGNALSGARVAGSIVNAGNNNPSFNPSGVANNNASQGQFVLKGSDLVLATQRANNNLNIRRGY
jgi:hypothetical protein